MTEPRLFFGMKRPEIGGPDMPEYMIERTIRIAHRKGVDDYKVQAFGPFRSRRLAEKAMVAMAGNAEVESAMLRDLGPEQKEGLDTR